MTNEAKSHSWWQTMPGVLSAVAGIITAVAGLLTILYQAGLFEHGRNKDASTVASPPTLTEKSGSQSRVEMPEQKTSQSQVAPPVNLLDPENGGHVVVSSGDDWLGTIDGKEDFNQIGYGLGDQNQAVYAFKDETAAVIDSFKILINGTEDSNVKEFELFIGNTSPTGPFQSIGVFVTQNIKIYASPYQEFKLPHVTAKYLKVKLLSTYGWPHPVLTEVQAFGRFVE